MKLADLSKETLPFEVALPAGVLKGAFRPQAYTPRVEQLVGEAQDGPAPAQALADALSRLLVSWDLEGEDGEPYPTSLEALLEVPVPVLGEVFRAIAQAMVPKPKSAARSGAG
ncbi:MAG: hypothetical protein HYR64_03755 [Fimbriimonas ginsengisoli]|uniref:Phage tail assembly protein n=1 Tax=Fimbriimonas ginsengisoli TaxID=1005039 RepID=A0A931LU42_FIMGI|nr:hypothetical protein [Fimbriimonas ginsengisoli]